MELLFVIVIAAGLGAIVRYALPRRDTYGVLLLPAASAVATAVVWVGLGLFLLRWTFDGAWIWVMSLGAGVIAALVLALVLPRRRVESDATMLARLSHS